MPRRGGGGRPMARPASPPPAPRRAAPPPAPVPAQPQAVMQPQQRQPGMFAQMASTAAGVAVGSAVGHTIGHAMTGGGGSQASAQDQQAPVEQYQQPPMQQYQQDPNNAVCGLELKQFMECAQNQSDISLCQGFNQVLRECRMRNGISS